MLCWFIGGAVLIVSSVFRDPRFDYRLLIVGVLAPDLLDAPFGGARVAHTLLASVALLTVVMLATRSRRLLRRRLLGIPIGTFLHLVLDGAWGDAQVFWWPFLGSSFEGARLPVVERGAWSVVLEAIGVVLVVTGWRRFGLADRRRRTSFRASGVLQTVA